MGANQSTTTTRMEASTTEASTSDSAAMAPIAIPRFRAPETFEQKLYRKVSILRLITFTVVGGRDARKWYTLNVLFMSISCASFC